MTWSKEQWREKRRVGRTAFINRTALGWGLGMLPFLLFYVLVLPVLLGEHGYLTWNRVAWTAVATVGVLPIGSWALGALLWWDMERRYPDLE